MQQLLNNNNLILMEASIVESLRRNEHIDLHPVLVNASLIYQKAGRKALEDLYQKYIDIAIEANTPFLMCTPTWRTNRSRVIESGIQDSINIDAVEFLKDLRARQPEGRESIRIGGMIGCKNDCYKPEQALSAAEAEQFHAWQLEQLSTGGADFLIAETLPEINEAIGVARAMASTGLPYIISFVISRQGRMLDGTHLNDAIGLIDTQTAQKPLGYMVNCAYPSFLCAHTQPPEVFARLIGYQANASALDHSELDGAEDLHMEMVADWGDVMLMLNRQHGVKILGGCCGTNEEHLRYISQQGS